MTPLSRSVRLMRALFSCQLPLGMHRWGPHFKMPLSCAYWTHYQPFFTMPHFWKSHIQYWTWVYMIWCDTYSTFISDTLPLIRAGHTNVSAVDLKLFTFGLSIMHASLSAIKMIRSEPDSQPSTSKILMSCFGCWWLGYVRTHSDRNKHSTYMKSICVNYSTTKSLLPYVFIKTMNCGLIGLTWRPSIIREGLQKI